MQCPETWSRAANSQLTRKPPRESWGGCDREVGVPCHRLQVEMPTPLTSCIFERDPECQKPLVQQNAGQGQECPAERQDHDKRERLKAPGTGRVCSDPGKGPDFNLE